MTLASNDMFRVGELAENIHSVWSMPVNVVIALSMAWRLLGVATLPAITIAILALAYNLHSSYAFTHIQDNLNSHQQQRLQALAEVLDVGCLARFAEVICNGCLLCCFSPRAYKLRSCCHWSIELLQRFDLCERQS
jgi:hypothetical protein